MESFFAVTGGLDGDNGATARGLVFVQVYAAYEHAVNGVVRISIDSINAHKHKMKEISHSLLALYLDSEFHSLRDSGRRNIWRARLNVLNRAFSDEVISLPNNAGPPTDGNHYRRSHLYMILEVFGITSLPVLPQHLTRIDEVVGNRNQIAHGGETAFEVGRRYTVSDVDHVIDQMKVICLSLVDVFEEFCADSPRQKRR